MNKEKKISSAFSSSLGGGQEEAIKELVKEKYSAIAEQSQIQNATSCCGATSSCCGDGTYTIMSDDYTKLEGYNPDADLGLVADCQQNLPT